MSNTIRINSEIMVDWLAGITCLVVRAVNGDSLEINKIDTMKELQWVTGLDLSDVEDLVEAALPNCDPVTLIAKRICSESDLQWSK